MPDIVSGSIKRTLFKESIQVFSFVAGRIMSIMRASFELI